MWTAALQPVAGGGIPPTSSAIELTLTFKDGGAFDFATTFDRIRERLRQAIELARESGTMVGEGSHAGTGRGGGALSGVNLSAVHLDELPAYSGPTEGGSPIPPQVVDPGVTLSGESVNGVDEEQIRSQSANPHTSTFEAPSEPPPGYEEVQQQSVTSELESRLMRQ